MKKIFVLFLIFVLLVSAVGCASGNTGETRSEKPATEKPETAETGTSKATSAQSDAGGTAGAVTLAAYPVRSPYVMEPQEAYDKWHAEWKARMALVPTYQSAATAFSAKTVPQILSGTKEENRVYSPMNLWLALAMLTESSAGESRQQILDLLGADSVEAVREMAKAMWEANYIDDGSSTCLLANSVWLSDGKEYRAEVLQTLADDYYASSFSGKMGSAEYHALLHDWLNEQTKGLLQEQAGGMEFYEETVMALASTIYFKSAWRDTFEDHETQEMTFHAPAGDAQRSFVQKTKYMTYYWGDEFGALWLPLMAGGGMWIVLPDEGIALDAMLNSDEYLRFQQAGRNWERQYGTDVHLALPKFDVSGELDLIEDLSKLGVTDIFHAGLADFSPVFKDPADISVSQITHAARVKIDEDGCEGAAFTMISKEEEAAETESGKIKEFIADRPFLFAVTAEGGTILFAGVVNEP